MNRDYVLNRIKTIVSSYVGIDPDDIDESDALNEFHLDDMAIYFLLEKIEEEFECEFMAGDIISESTVGDIVMKLMEM